jgi:uncharacterized protein YceK
VDIGKVVKLLLGSPHWQTHACPFAEVSLEVGSHFQQKKKFLCKKRAEPSNRSAEDMSWGCEGLPTFFLPKTRVLETTQITILPIAAAAATVSAT